MAYRVKIAECRVQSTEYGLQSKDCRVQSTAYRAKIPECRVQCTEHRALVLIVILVVDSNDAKYARGNFWRIVGWRSMLVNSFK